MTLFVVCLLVSDIDCPPLPNVKLLGLPTSPKVTLVVLCDVEILVAANGGTSAKS